ncbi:MAG TPA: endonuclease NucS domain-containing protein [Gemmataceae bacterium]|nr:endonuclease NucS domain-containing protein [Gemmataceae bacterium]
MPQQVRLWQVSRGDALIECTEASLDLEARLEEWLARDISLVSDDLLVIGRQVETAFGGVIDLLCIDREGDLVITELKRDKTPREITAQVLDYASWVSDLSRDAISTIAAQHFGSATSLEDAFRKRFSEELPESLNENHRMLIVASKIDSSSERIVKYLSTNYGVNINVVTFHYFKPADSSEFLARVFLIDPNQVEYQTRAKGQSRRRPNLSYEELEQLAEQNGVGGLYRSLVEGLEEYLQKHRTISSIAFTGIFDKSRRTVISLLPGQSSPVDGLHYQVYLGRFCRLFGLEDKSVLAILPPRRKSWKYYDTAGDDYTGFEGFFTTNEDVDRFLQGLAKREIAAS